MSQGPRCIFCGQRRKLSREHVVPQWVSRVLSKDPRGWPAPIRGYRQDREGNVTRTFVGSKVVELVMRRVCKVCNEGWMEQQLERPSQPILGPMLAGQAVTLDPAAQSLLAAWMAKTAMVYGYTTSPVMELAPDWLTHMYQRQRAPDTWHVWIATYIGSRPVFSHHADITLSFPDDSPGTPHGVLMTLVIGYVAFKVLGVYGGTPSDPGPEVMARLWPPPDTPTDLSWPPPGYLDETPLPAFANLFLDKPGEEPPPLPPPPP